VGKYALVSFAQKPLTKEIAHSPPILRRELHSARFPAVAIVGVSVAAVATAAYAYAQRSMTIVTQGSLSQGESAAVVYLLVMTAAVAAVILDARRIVSQRVATIRLQGIVPTSPGWLMPYVLSVRKYRRYFVFSTVIYGLFYAIITSMVVYQPQVDFVQAYGVAIPSVSLTPRGGPLYAPDLIVYVSNHLGLQLIPLTMLLLIAISVLVGLNVALSIFAFDSGAKGGGRGAVGSLGAAVGLFTGCPTCAGVFFANTLGGSGVASFTALLGYYQPAFILISLPVLLATPYLTCASLARVFRDGCVRVRP